MKTKFLSFLAAGFAACMFSACSDDSSSTSAKGEEPEVDNSVPVKEEIANEIPNTESKEVADFDSYEYFGAELTGIDQFHYGKFEAKMKMASIPGSVSSMFLYYDNSWMKEDEPWNEIDIEVLGKNPGEWQSNLITRNGDGTKGKNTSSEYVTGFGFDATKDFHVYVMEWTPEYISWTIDGKVIRRDVITPGEEVVAKNQVTFINLEQSLRFNLWASKSAPWVGKFTGAELADGAVTQEIDYVKVYSYDETTKEFKEEWTDEFDGTDLSEHWSRGNWEMEHVMLSEDNVVVEDGVCKLLLTRKAK